VRSVVRRKEVVHRNDVGVLEPCGDPRLAHEPVLVLGASSLRAQRLDCDRAVQPRLCAEADLRHPAAAERAADLDPDFGVALRFRRARRHRTERVPVDRVVLGVRHQGAGLAVGG
jgi:hypothetical protein